MVIVREAPIVSGNVTDAVFCGLLLSFTDTETLPENAAVGVPVMTPVEALMLSDAGRPEADQVYGVAPPVAATEAL